MSLLAAFKLIWPEPGIRFKDFSAASLHGFVAANVAPGATIKTDGWPSYARAPDVQHERDCPDFRVWGTRGRVSYDFSRGEGEKGTAGRGWLPSRQRRGSDRE